MCVCVCLHQMQVGHNGRQMTGTNKVINVLTMISSGVGGGFLLKKTVGFGLVMMVSAIHPTAEHHQFPFIVFFCLPTGGGYQFMLSHKLPV